MSPQKILPRVGVVVAQPLRVLALQGDDVRPHVPGDGLHLSNGGVEIHVVLVTE